MATRPFFGRILTLRQSMTTRLAWFLAVPVVASGVALTTWLVQQGERAATAADESTPLLVSVAADPAGNRLCTAPGIHRCGSLSPRQ